jgi:ribosomal RNA assembly protein
MEQVYSESANKIALNKKLLEESLNVTLDFRDRIVFIDGSPEDSLIALSIIEAITFGFSITKSLQLKQEGFVFRKVNIKSLTDRKNIAQVRARVIGTKRKAMDTLERLSNCDISLHNSTVGIIGLEEDIKKAEFALSNLIKGSKHSDVYNYLETQRALEE